MRVEGPTSFHLLAVWAIHSQEPGEKRKEVVGPLLSAINRYAEFMASAPLVVCGDFNNHVQWDVPGKLNNHANAVDRLRQLGLFSACHHSRSVAQGAESEPTHYWRDRTKNGFTFHIDHCLLPIAWQAALRQFEVGPFEEWTGKGYSDHVPLIADIAV